MTTFYLFSMKQLDMDKLSEYGEVDQIRDRDFAQMRSFISFDFWESSKQNLLVFFHDIHEDIIKSMLHSAYKLKFYSQFEEITFRLSGGSNIIHPNEDSEDQYPNQLWIFNDYDLYNIHRLWYPIQIEFDHNDYELNEINKILDEIDTKRIIINDLEDMLMHDSSDRSIDDENQIMQDLEHAKLDLVEMNPQSVVNEHEKIFEKHWIIKDTLYKTILLLQKKLIKI